MIVQNQEMTIEMLKQNIQELQQNINNQEFADIQIQTSLYVLDNNLMKTEIAFGEYLISMNYNSNENKLIIKNETGDIEGFDTIEVKKSESEEQYVLSIDVTNSNNIENSIKLQLSRVGKTSSNTIRDLAILTINAENSVYSVKYSNNINFENNIEIEELNQDNSIILNTYSGEEVKNLLIAIEDRTKQVWNEKMQMLGSGGEEGTIIEEFTNQENSDELAQNQETELTATEKLAIEMYNEQFLAYLGESVSADNVKKLLSVTRGAIQNQNHINVKYSGTYNNTAVEKEVSTIEDVEALDIYIVNGKSYFVEGVADYTGKLEALTIKENEN